MPCYKPLVLRWEPAPSMLVFSLLDTKNSSFHNVTQVRSLSLDGYIDDVIGTTSLTLSQLQDLINWSTISIQPLNSRPHNYRKQSAIPQNQTLYMTESPPLFTTKKVTHTAICQKLFTSHLHATIYVASPQQNKIFKPKQTKC